MSFKENMYEVVRNAIPEDLVNYISLQIDLIEKAYLIMIKSPTEENPYPFDDVQSRKTFSTYGTIPGDALLKFLKNKVSKITNKRLCESYSYLRAYYRGSCFEKHVDRDSCEYSCTICLRKDEFDWPIYFEDLNGNQIEVELENGDMIVYKGTDLNHWREPYTGNRHLQLFLHYIDSDGDFFPKYRYDRRRGLIFPFEDIFRNEQK